MTKPNIVKIEPTQGYGTIIVMNCQIESENEFQKASSYLSFKRNMKTFEFIVETEIIAILKSYGIEITDNKKESVAKAFDTLNRKYHKNIIIVDCHADTEEKVIYREKGATFIEYDNLIEVANEIKVVEVC